MAKEFDGRGRRIVTDCCWTVPPLSALTALLTMLITKNSALFYVAFIEEFGISHQSASWPLLLNQIMAHVAGFLVGYLQEKWSIYHIAVAGSLLNFVALIAASCAPNIVWMIITLGLISGTGICMIMLTLSLYAMLYFDKYRATASGFKYTGMSVAPLAFPMVLSALLREYGLHGTLLILSAFMLNTLPLAMLMNKPKPFKLCCWRNTADPHNDTRDEKTATTTAPLRISVPCLSFHRSSNKYIVTNGKLGNSAAEGGTVVNTFSPQQTPQWAHAEEGGVGRSDIAQDDVHNEESRKADMLLAREAVVQSRQGEDNHAFDASGEAKDCIKPGVTSKNSASLSHFGMPLKPKERFHQNGTANGTANIPNTCFQTKFLVHAKDNKAEGDGGITRIPQLTRQESVTTENEEIPTGGILDLLKNPVLYLLVITFGVGEYISITFETTVLDYAVDKGSLKSKAEHVIVYVAAAEMAGRLVVPFFWDRAGFRRSLLVAICLVVEATCLVAMPHATSFGEVVATAVATGLPAGCVVAMKPVLLSDCLGVQKLSICWGIAGIAMLPVALGGPLLIGLFRDTMGSYDNLYRTLAGMCAVFAVLLFGFAYYEIRCHRNRPDSAKTGENNCFDEKTTKH